MDVERKGEHLKELAVSSPSSSAAASCEWIHAGYPSTWSTASLNDGNPIGRRFLRLQKVVRTFRDLLSQLSLSKPGQGLRAPNSDRTLPPDWTQAGGRHWTKHVHSPNYSQH
ncbi:hypothetical protein ElyMa_000703300 [Elysia marginata]|uniref:Uncharacterized protein n=1 Tax=Elysia marginata TaxID=1093978 RepID=A0AAV4GJU0_9GAST|nr:hypothetical protein ElyMa_000703300 [Elysia marginata]